MMREIAVVHKLSETEALKLIETPAQEERQARAADRRGRG